MSNIPEIQIESRESQHFTTEEVEMVRALLESYPIHNHDGRNTLEVATSKIRKAIDSYNIIIPTNAIAGENLNDGDALQVGVDGKIYKAHSTNFNAIKRYIGISNSACSIGSTPSIIRSGIKSNYTGLTPGTLYYLTLTPGVIGTAFGANAWQPKTYQLHDIVYYNNAYFISKIAGYTSSFEYEYWSLYIPQPVAIALDDKTLYIL